MLKSSDRGRVMRMSFFALAKCARASRPRDSAVRTIAIVAARSTYRPSIKASDWPLWDITAAYCQTTLTLILYAILWMSKCSGHNTQIYLYLVSFVYPCQMAQCNYLRSEWPHWSSSFIARDLLLKLTPEIRSYFLPSLFAWWLTWIPTVHT